MTKSYRNCIDSTNISIENIQDPEATIREGAYGQRVFPFKKVPDRRKVWTEEQEGSLESPIDPRSNQKSNSRAVDPSTTRPKKAVRRSCHSKENVPIRIIERRREQAGLRLGTHSSQVYGPKTPDCRLQKGICQISPSCKSYDQTKTH